MKKLFRPFPSTILGLLLLFMTGCENEEPLPTTVTDIDGNIYHTITIGKQVWMVENLKTTTFRDGTPIPNIAENEEWGQLTTSAFCDYENSSNNSDKYGRLYNWYAASDTRNIAPSGWRVPTEADWDELDKYLRENGFNASPSEQSTAKALAALTGWQASSNPGSVGNTDFPDLRNKTGFTALPGGERSRYGDYFGSGSISAWWSTGSLEQIGGKDGGYVIQEEVGIGSWIQSESTYFTGLSTPKSFGLSIRCLMDR